MSKQRFHTRDVLALEVKGPPIDWRTNRYYAETAAERLARWTTDGTVDVTASGATLTATTGTRATQSHMVGEPVLIEAGETRVRYAHLTTVAGRVFRIRLRWFDGAGETLWVTPWVYYGAGALGVTGTGVVTVPGYAHAVGAEIELGGGGDEFPAASSSAGAYAFTHATLWLGTAADATSMESEAPVNAHAPQWVDVLPDASSIDLDRYVLDAGSLSWSLPDVAYTPSGPSPLLRPGREVRLRIKGGENLFRGTLSEVVPDHYPAARLAKHRRVIRATAVTRDAALSTHDAAAGPGRLFGAAQIFDGVGVPWVVSGASKSAVDWPLNGQSGSAMDHLVVCRDTIGAHAWVDRSGVAQVWHPHQITGITRAYAAGDFVGSRSTAGWVSSVNMSEFVMDGRGWAVMRAATASGLVEAIGPGSTNAHEVTPGETVEVTISVAAPSIDRTARIGLRWYDSSGSALSTVGVDTTPVPASTSSAPVWHTRSTTTTVPANACYLAVLVGFYASTSGPTLLVRYADVRSTTRIAPTRNMSVSSTQYTDYVERTPQRFNHVTVDVVNGSSSTTYGPFINIAGQRRRGVQAVTLTAAPYTLAPEAWAGRHARAFMGRGGDPDAPSEVASLTFPILEAPADLTIADRDLYDDVLVLNNPLVRADHMRIVGIRHRITAHPPQWLVTFDLAAAAAPALPTVST